jgi:phage gp45-like
MDRRSAIAEVERRLRAYVAQTILNVVEWSATTATSAKGDADAVAGLPADRSPQLDVLRVQHFGFISVPVNGGNRIVLAKGSRKWSVAEDGAGYAPTDLTEGEVAAFSKWLQYGLYLGSDGKVYVGDKAGTQPAVLGNTEKTNLDNIKTDLDAAKTDLQSVSSFCSNLLTALNGASNSGGTVSYIPPLPGPPTVTISPHTPTDPRSSVVNVK